MKAGVFGGFGNINESLCEYFGEVFAGCCYGCNSKFLYENVNRSRCQECRERRTDFDVLDTPNSSKYLPPVTLNSGGSGLVSTITDYLQFAQCILNNGEMNDVRLLGTKTVELMTCNHLTPDLLPIAFEGIEPMLGMGFGLGFGVMLDPAQTGVMGSVGDYSWGGGAETYFLNDPREELIAIFMTRFLASGYRSCCGPHKRRRSPSFRTTDKWLC